MDPEIDDEPPFIEVIFRDESDHGSDDEGGIDWDMWWQIIVHRNAGIHEAEMPEYPDEAWSLEPKNAPFPFNLEATWYCVMILAIILGAHCEIDTKWMLSHGYISSFMRISSKTLLTVAISFASTLLFEVIGNVIDLIRESYVREIIIRTNAWFVQTFHWGPVDEEGRALWDGHIGIEFHHDPTHIRERIRSALTNIILIIFDYSFTVLSYQIPTLISKGIVWLASLVSTDLSSFLDNLSTYFGLPTPGLDGTSNLETLLWEFGPPIYLQLWAAALIYLFVFVFMSRAETPLILHNTGLDPFSKLAFNLLRATSLHLLAYTAYQIVCLVVTVTPPFWPSNILYLALKRNTNVRFNLRFYPGYGVAIMAAHWIVKSICKLLVRLLYSLWVPYIVWLSIKTEIATRHNWVVYGPLLNGDMDVLDLGNRVIGRASMTTMFGLKSSWPARMRMSSNENID